jgi:WD40 repeat protein
MVHGRSPAGLIRATQGSTVLRFSPDNHSMVTADRKGICLWQTSDWTQIASANGSTLGAMEFSPDGRVVATISVGGHVRLLDAHTLADLATFQPPDGLLPRSLAFSPDSATLAVSTVNSRVLHVWDLRRIREHLASMGVDWALPALAPAEISPTPVPLKVEAHLDDFSPGSGRETP